MATFVEALYQRYSESMCEDSSIELFIVGGFSPGKSGNHLMLPPAVSLTRCNIKKSGAEHAIRDCCRDVEELDLASNHLTDLNQVYNIAKEMPYLRFLNLSENDFSEVNVDQIKPHELHSVRSLVLNNTSIPWSAVQLLLDSMPNLQDLHICLNNYRTLEVLPKCYNVKRIYISKNPTLTSCQQIKNLLIAFPHLKSLTMADCNISNIPEDLHNLLPKLKSLNISNWPVTSWSSIDNLNSFPELNELRCQGCKVLDEFDNPEVRRNHLIARLPKVQRLNGSEIVDDERLHAERHFIRWFDERKALEKPKRYFELFNKYGNVPALASVDLRPPVKCAEVTIIFRKGDGDKENEHLQGESKKITVDLKQTVKDLKAQIRQVLCISVGLKKTLKTDLSVLFKLPVSRIRLFYCDQEFYEIAGAEELKLPQRKLFNYKVRNGDSFMFDDKKSV